MRVGSGGERTVDCEINVGCGLSMKNDAVRRPFDCSRVHVRAIGEIERKSNSSGRSRVPKVPEASQCEYRMSVNSDILAFGRGAEGRKKRALEVCVCKVTRRRVEDGSRMRVTEIVEE